jgi:hypothetical protein
MTIETSERGPYAPRWSDRDKQQQPQLITDAVNFSAVIQQKIIAAELRM